MGKTIMIVSITAAVVRNVPPTTPWEKASLAIISDISALTLNPRASATRLLPLTPAAAPPPKNLARIAASEKASILKPSPGMLYGSILNPMLAKKTVEKAPSS